MLEDNPTVPTLLTDYILKHICPSESYIVNTCDNNTRNFGNTTKSMIRPFSSGSNGIRAHNAALSQLTTSLNNKLKAARRSFSFSNKSSSNWIDFSQHQQHPNNNNNNNLDPESRSRKSSISGTSTTFDPCNAIVA